MQWTRQQEILSEEGQAVLANHRVALIGTGGIESHFALLAAHVGFRNFILVDPDSNQEENRNRSARETDLGRPKVECLREQIQAINSEISVATHSCKIQEFPEVLEEATVIASCADNWQARSFVNQEAVKRSKTLVDMGFGYANGQMGCHAALYNPGGGLPLVRHSPGRGSPSLQRLFSSNHDDRGQPRYGTPGRKLDELRPRR